jgi:hypothetical protein
MPPLDDDIRQLLTTFTAGGDSPDERRIEDGLTKARTGGRRRLRRRRAVAAAATLGIAAMLVAVRHTPPATSLDTFGQPVPHLPDSLPTAPPTAPTTTATGTTGPAAAPRATSVAPTITTNPRTSAPPPTTSAPAPSPIRPTDGTYADDESDSVPRYLLSVAYTTPDAIQGSITFIYQDGRTETAGNYTAALSSTGTTTMQFGDGNTLPLTVQADTLQLAGCDALLRWATRPGSCTFTHMPTSPVTPPR